MNSILKIGENKMNEYVKVKYWFDPSKDAEDNRYYSDQEGWKYATMTRDEARTVVFNRTLKKASMIEGVFK